MPRLWTIGHGTADELSFTQLLKSAGIGALVDVRIGPGSRKFPHFNKDLMAQWLPEAGISYRWEKRLGGFRKLLPGSPDTALRNDSFRAYAGYMRTADFQDAFTEVIKDVARTPTAIMCSESVWWRCHRRLISDYATLLAGVSVEHLMPGGRHTPHPPTPGVRVGNNELVYDLAPADP